MGPEEAESQVLLRKEEWTIWWRGCDLSFPYNILVSGDHCKIIVDETSAPVLLEDTNTDGIVINQLKVVEKQTYLSLTGRDVICLVYRKNEPEHNVAYLYKSLNEKQGMAHVSFEAKKENIFHITKDISGAGRGDYPQDLPLSQNTQECFKELQPLTSMLVWTKRATC